MDQSSVNRRAALRQIMSFAAGGAAIVAGLSACDNAGEKQQAANVCVDMDELSVSEAGIRKGSHYVEQSPDPARICNGCAFFAMPESAGTCGTCQIFSGPANANGHCDSWAAKS